MGVGRGRGRLEGAVGKFLRKEKVQPCHISYKSQIRDNSSDCREKNTMETLLWDTSLRGNLY